MGNNVNLQINSSVELDGGGDENLNQSGSSGINLKQRLSSWALWLAVFGLVGLVLETAGVFRKWGITDEGWNAIITAVGTVLSAFGIVNNPTERGKL